MTPLQKAARAVTDFGRKAGLLLFGTRGTWAGVLLGATRWNYAATTNPLNNGIVIACLEAFVTAFSEAPLRVQKVNRKGDSQPIPDHPLVLLLERPNPYYSGVLLWKALVSDWLLGNGYLWKRRAGSLRGEPGRVVELYWLPSNLVEPKWPDDGSAFLSHYEYTPNGEATRLRTEDIVHLRNGFDPDNIRKGRSRLAALLREIATDDEASQYTMSLLKNLGVPGMVIAPKGEADLPEGEAENIKLTAMNRFTGDRRGEPLVMTGPTEITTFGFNPQQMVLKDLRRIPEERISAAIGVPAIVAGLGAGLDRSTFANVAEAREQLYETTIIPTYRLFAAELSTQLLPEFEGDNRNVRLDFDLSEVRVLQQDQDALHLRVQGDVGAGLLTINEGRAELGMPPLPEGGDVLLLPTTVMPTLPAEMLMSAPEPMDTGIAALPAGRGDAAAA